MKPILYSRRQIALGGGLLLLFLLPAFTALGFWQWDRAQQKFARQAELELRSRGAPAAMPASPAPVDGLRHRRFVLAGEYDPDRQILIDNRIHRGRAGYHVVTPLRLAGSGLHVLVNRGWIPAAPDRRDLPQAPPPAGPLRLTGIAVAPGEKFFTLAPSPAGTPGREAGHEENHETGRTASPEKVWQNLDLQRFRESAPYPVQSAIIQLDADAPGGYVREWPRPDDGADRNLGYALQWWGFAATSLGIWLHFLLRRR